MDKARTITDTKTLWGEDPDKRNPCCASICLNYSHFRETLWGEDPDKRNPCCASICLNYSHFRVLSYMPSHFVHLFGLCMDSKNNINRMFPLMPSLVELILFELLSEVERTQEGHHKLSIPVYS